MYINLTAARYTLASGASFVLVVLLMVAHTGFAQTTTAPSCLANTSTIGVNQSVTFTATGGNGSYTWSGDTLGAGNSGSQLTVSYPNPGNYTVQVMSNGGTATCPITVVGSPSPVVINNNSGTLACLPTSQNVTLGQTAFVSATGGNGNYTWTAPDLITNNPFGSGFSASYASAGTHVITVSSNGSSASCTVNVIGPTYIPPPIYVPTPGLPNTGGGYGHW